MSETRRRLLCGLFGFVALALSIGLFLLWQDPVERGLASRNWPATSAEILAARFYSEYNAAASSGSDGEVRDTSAKITVAYTVDADNGPQHYETSHFDAFGPRNHDEGMMVGEAAEVRAVMKAGPDLRVYYNPETPGEAIVQPGIPHYSSALLLLPVTLLGLAIGLIAWSLLPDRADSSPTNKAETVNTRHLLGLICWGTMFPMAAMIPILLLRPAWVWMFDRVPPWWLVPGFYIFGLVLYITPSQVFLWKPVNLIFSSALTAVLLALPSLIVAGVLASFIEPSNRSFGFELTDDECVARLNNKHPAVARRAAWEIRNRRGPRDAVPGLCRLLSHPDTKTRETALLALKRLGLGAMVALDELEERVERPENAEIRGEFEALIRQLHNYQSTQEKVPLKQDLLRDPSEITRLAAAFWLGQVGEFGIPALPDLEAALIDPRNKNITPNIKEAIRRIRCAQHAHCGKQCSLRAHGVEEQPSTGSSESN